MYDFEVGNKFLNMTSKTIDKVNNYRLNFFRIKKLWSMKHTIRRIKRQATHWQEY